MFGLGAKSFLCTLQRLVFAPVTPTTHQNDYPLLQIPGADEHRPVRVLVAGVAGKIFAARFLFYGRAVASEYGQLVFPVSPKS